MNPLFHDTMLLGDIRAADSAHVVFPCPDTAEIVQIRARLAGSPILGVSELLPGVHAISPEIAGELIGAVGQGTPLATAALDALLKIAVRWRCRPDTVVLDREAPGPEGFVATAIVSAASPLTPVKLSGALGEIVTGTAAAIAVASWAVSNYGDDLLNLIGFGDCSDKNKKKYRSIVDAMTPDQWYAAMQSGKVGSATGRCNEYALRYMGGKAKTYANSHGLQIPAAGGGAAQQERRGARTQADIRADAERVLARRLSAAACGQALREIPGMTDAANRGLFREMSQRCGPSTTPACDWDATLLDVGVGQDGYCAATTQQQQQYRMRLSRMSAAQLAVLRGLPIADRDRVSRMMELDPSYMPPAASGPLPPADSAQMSPAPPAGAYDGGYMSGYAPAPAGSSKTLYIALGGALVVAGGYFMVRRMRQPAPVRRVAVVQQPAV